MNKLPAEVKFQKRSYISGFSVIEILLVVIIIGILAVFLVPRLINPSDEVRITRAKQDILILQQALELYKQDNGIYPSTEQGLRALIIEPQSTPRPMRWRIGGYLPRVPIDPWGRHYQYLNPGIKNSNGIDIFSYGPDGRPGPTGKSKVIGNWNKN